MFSLFSNLPRPVQAMVMLAGGAGIMSVGMAFVPGPQQVLFKWIAIGVVALVLILLLYKLVLFLKDKARSGPFAAMLAKGSGRAGADPAQKARMDDLRKKFEEGVTTFKAAGKDLYSLPWFLLVGPAGSGKTEALRHCNVGFPPGLQDCLQGAGGTLNMHWWFTNHSVVLDTAGRMFMTEEDPEWKQFLKMLKTARPRCPINGLLLVISSESLLKDSSEKIEQTAGAIARQLDVVQRTLDVRFPVSVIVTKCDKIIGFRDFFDTLSDPSVQHQILGWSNPANLDEKFDPATVDKHLDSVRQRLIRRRYGLLQNPIHTSDPNARRTDQVDEMFELPDNLMRIAPRLRRYLEMIFVAGEWSPKPLFLRGIYFTSSMREGQALDVTLAQALGVDVEAIPGGKEWDKDKSYFLRDVFMAKVFREKGLVTRAVNVSKTLQRQRTLLVGTAMAATIIIAGLTVLGYFGFKTSLGPPSIFWRNVRTAFVGNEAQGVDPMNLAVLARDPQNPAAPPVFTGGTPFEDTSVLGDDFDTPVKVLDETQRRADKTLGRIDTPAIAKPIGPFLGFGDGFVEEQQKAHRAVLEATTIAPLLEEARSKLQNEQRWDANAVGALAQLVRIQTYAHEKEPACEGGGLLSAIKEGVDEAKGAKAKPKAGPRPAVDVDVLFRYVLPGPVYTDQKAYKGAKDTFAKAVANAYPNGFKDVAPSDLLAGKEPRSINTVSDAADRLIAHLLSLGGASEGSDMYRLNKLQAGLVRFREGEAELQRMSSLQKGGAASEVGQNPRNPGEYSRFEQDAKASLEKIAQGKKEIDDAVESLGADADDPVALLAKAGRQLQSEVEAYFDQLIEQLPPSPGEGKPEALAKLAESSEPQVLRDLRDKLAGKRKEVGERVAAELEKRREEIRALASMVTPGKADREEARVYGARWACYEKALEALTAAAKPVPEGEAGRVHTLTADFADIATGVENAGLTIGSWNAWAGTSAGLRLLDEGQKKDMDDERLEAIRVARRVVDIAAGKRQYDAVMYAIAHWPKDSDLLAERVKQLADERVDGDAARPMKKLTTPSIPLTDLKGKEEFDRQFHIEAAKEIMGDYDQMYRLVQPDSTGKGPKLMGADSIKEDRSYRLAGQVAGEYGTRFAGYWRTQALDRSRASVGTWEEFRTGLQEAFPTEIRDELEKLMKLSLEAYDAIPASIRPSGYERDKRDIPEHFAGLENKAFQEDFSEQLRAWKGLARKSPTDARDELVKLWIDGKVKKRYFAAYRQQGRGLKYWNDAELHGVRLLIDATNPDLKGARDALLGASRGVPLVTCPDTAPDLTLAQVRAAAEAVQKLAGALGTGSGNSGVRDEELEPEIDAQLRELSGDNFVNRNEATRVWFGKLRSVVEALGGARSLSVGIVPTANPPTPPRGGAGDLASDKFRYARLYIGDTPIGEAFNLTTAIDPAKADKLRLPLPLPDGQTASIGLFANDPPQGDKQQVKPAAEIALPGRWHVLKAGVLESGGGMTTDGGAWRVFVAGGGYYLWLDVSLDKDAKVPARSAWPTWREWPDQ